MPIRSRPSNPLRIAILCLPESGSLLPAGRTVKNEGGRLAAASRSSFAFGEAYLSIENSWVCGLFEPVVRMNVSTAGSSRRQMSRPLVMSDSYSLPLYQ